MASKVCGLATPAITAATASCRDATRPPGPLALQSSTGEQTVTVGAFVLSGAAIGAIIGVLRDRTSGLQR